MIAPGREDRVGTTVWLRMLTEWIRTPRHISKILAEPALAELLASSGEVNDE